MYLVTAAMKLLCVYPLRYMKRPCSDELHACSCRAGEWHRQRTTAATQKLTGTGTRMACHPRAQMKLQRITMQLIR